MKEYLLVVLEVSETLLESQTMLYRCNNYEAAKLKMLNEIESIKSSILEYDNPTYDIFIDEDEARIDFDSNLYWSIKIISPKDEIAVVGF